MPIKNLFSVTCFSFIKAKSNSSFNLFAVADIKFKCLGTPLFEKYNRNINLHFSTMIFKHSLEDQPTAVSFTTLIEVKCTLFRLSNRSIHNNQLMLNTILYKFYISHKTIWKVCCLKQNLLNILLKYLKVNFCYNWNHFSLFLNF